VKLPPSGRSIEILAVFMLDAAAYTPRVPIAVPLQGASIRYRIAVGPIAGRKTLRLHTAGGALERAQQPKRFTAARDGFSLNAAVA
jgi:hypothetical protein